MQFKGKIIEALPVITGQSARGQWVKQGFVLEYEPGQYPKQIAFDVFGSDRLQEMRISVGEELICDIDFKVVKGKNGNTFNNVDCWRVTRANQVQQQQTHVIQQQPPQQQPVQQPEAQVQQIQPQTVEQHQTPIQDTNSNDNFDKLPF